MKGGDNMKWSPILHGVSAIAGVLGLLALFAAWFARAEGTVLGLTQAHLFNDAMSLLLASIAFGLGTLIHMKQEKS